jgi:transportin-3
MHHLTNVVLDHIQLLKIFAQYVVPYVDYDQENPAVKYWQEVFPVMTKVLDSFVDFVPICERICRCWRTMLTSYRTAMAPLLGPMAEKLAEGFTKSNQGCFLWVTGAVLREFSEDREHTDDTVADHIYVFFEAQATSVLRVMSSLPAYELPDVIEDFFRLLIDALLYYPHKLIASPLFVPIFQAAISALALEQQDPLSATLHYIRDVISYGGNNPASSVGLGAGHQQQVKQVLLDHGETLINRIMAGMMIELLPQQTTQWVDQTIRLLPQGTITPTEANRLMAKIKEKLGGSDAGGIRQVRALLQDFTNTYRRRYVAPRDGLGHLEAARFHFEG